MLPLTVPQYLYSVAIGASCIIWGKNHSIYYVFYRIRDQADALEMVRQHHDQGGPSYGRAGGIQPRCQTPQEPQTVSQAECPQRAGLQREGVGQGQWPSFPRS